MATKPVVMVIGATGAIGMATLKALVSMYGNKFDIRAGVRNPETSDEKFKDLKDSIKVVQATMGEERLSRTFQGVNRLFIVTPPTKDRGEVALATARFAKIAGVKSIVVLSVPAAVSKVLVFGPQFGKLEEAIKGLGIQFTIIRLPMFLDNYFGHIDSIKNQSSIYMPLDPTKPYTPIAACDAGKAVAVILSNPSRHAGKTYTLASNRHTMNEACQEFSRQLGKEVQYVHVSYEDAKESILQAGYLKDWQIDGLLELYKMVEKNSPVGNIPDLSDFHKITGSQPTSLADWITNVKQAFQ